MKIIILIFISVFSVKFIIIMHTQGLNQGWCSTISFNSVVYILGNKLQEIGYDHVALRRCKYYDIGYPILHVKKRICRAHIS